jgi:hypothetical protein
VAPVELLEAAYPLFDAREVEALLLLLTEDVEWPDVAGGTVLHGRDAVRRYWQAQLAAAAPRVRPLEYVAVGDDVVAVVEQRVDDHQGRPLVPSTTVFHRYSFAGDLVRRMVVLRERETAVADA